MAEISAAERIPGTGQVSRWELTAVSLAKGLSLISLGAV